MHSTTDPQGTRLPIKLDATTNGEFAPVALSSVNHEANNLAHQWVSENARRIGLSRRAFLVGACGAATTLLAFNAANGTVGKTGGRFAITPEAALDPELALAQLTGEEFIFDVQGHYVEPNGAWREGLSPNDRPFSWAAKSKCALSDPAQPYAYLDCLGPDEFMKDVFLDSDTDMMVLSFVPSRRDAEPVTIAEADAVRQIVERMEGSHRLLLHGRVNPNQPGDLESMDELHERWGVSAWKTYTQWGPDGRGYFLSDEDTGIPFIEKAQELGVKVICIHKGIPFGRRSYEHSQCRDIGVVAKRYPEMAFIVYHSGFVPGIEEREFVPGDGRDGVDTLLQSLMDNQVPPNSNVYAELGSTWRFLMRDPDSAAHLLGKLLRYVGERNVLWGTDSIWYGSPQDQIQAFRTFEISEAFQEQYGYPAMTPSLRAQVFGLNAAVPYRIELEKTLRVARKDPITRTRTAYRVEPDPHFTTYGPKTRRQFLEFLRRRDGIPNGSPG